MSRAFFDTKVLLYAYVEGDYRRERAHALIAAGGVISVQSLNEFANCARRKFGWDWPAIEMALSDLQIFASAIITLDLALHQSGLALAQRYKLATYDAMIVAAALIAGCDRLYSEEMHHGLLVEGRLTIENTFSI